MGCLKRSSAVLLFLPVWLSLWGAAATQDGGEGLSPVRAEAEALLSVCPGGGYSIGTTEHFVVAHAAGVSEAQELADLLEHAHQHFHLSFEQMGFDLATPAARLSWISFADSADYSAYARRADRADMSWLNGYYSAKTNRVAILGPHVFHDPAAQGVLVPAATGQAGDIAAMAGDDVPEPFMKIAHELAHQLAFNTGLQKRGVMYPLWVSEGLATRYETEVFGALNKARARRLVALRDQGRLMDLDELIGLTRLPDSLDRCEDVYAQAWGFFGFVADRRTAHLKDYLTHLSTLRRGARPAAALAGEFTDSFGPLLSLETDWAAYLGEQSP